MMANTDLPLKPDLSTSFWTRSQITSLLSAHNFREQDFVLPNVDEASWVMELLQAELDRTTTKLHSQYRKKCLKLIQQLNRAYGVLPPSMYLKGLICESKTAVAGGGFADVWIGRLNDQRVCVKVLRFFQQSSDRVKLQRALSKEVLLWRQLSHPSILPFLGINTELFSPSFCIISPWMPNGDIITYYSQKQSLDVDTKLKHLLQIAQGLVYLHGLDPPVVHGDIKGANILISDDNQCCLADFGLSVLDTQSVNPSHTATVQGSLRWLAPEFIHPPLQLTQLTLTPRDIYAFGCTVFEMLTGKPPFYDHVVDISVALDVLRGIRPVLPPDIVPPRIFAPLHSLLDRCWSEQIPQRPSAQEVLQYIVHLLDLMHELSESGSVINTPLSSALNGVKTDHSFYNKAPHPPIQNGNSSVTNMFTPFANFMAQSHSSSHLPDLSQPVSASNENSQKELEAHLSPIRGQEHAESPGTGSHSSSSGFNKWNERSKKDSRALRTKEPKTKQGSWWNRLLFNPVKRLWKHTLTRHKKRPVTPDPKDEFADREAGLVSASLEVTYSSNQGNLAHRWTLPRKPDSDSKNDITVSQYPAPFWNNLPPVTSSILHDGVDGGSWSSNHLDLGPSYQHASTWPDKLLLSSLRESSWDPQPTNPLVFASDNGDNGNKYTYDEEGFFSPVSGDMHVARYGLSVAQSMSYQPVETEVSRGPGGGLSWDDPALREAWNEYCQRQGILPVVVPSESTTSG